MRKWRAEGQGPQLRGAFKNPPHTLKTWFLPVSFPSAKELGLETVSAREGFLGKREIVLANPSIPSMEGQSWCHEDVF